MNEELQKQIADILKKAMEAAEQGGQWLSGQIPEVLKQLIAWTIMMGILSTLTAVSIVLAWVWFAPRHYRWVVDGNSYDCREFSYIGVACAAAASLGFLTWMIGIALDGLKALVAPKLFLLEYAAHLVT